MTTPRLPSAEEFCEEFAEELAGVWKDRTPPAILRAYARAVLEAAAEVAEAYMTGIGIEKSGVGDSIRALKLDP